MKAIFLLNKEDWCSMGRVRGTDLPCSKVFVNELNQSGKSSWDKEYIGP